MSANVRTLLEALPYIREFHGRTVVIKYGGAAMRDEEHREGNSYNVNADAAAGKVAAALRAYKAIFLTDVPGWLADPDDPGSLVTRATVSEVATALGEVQGGMRPKLGACIEAIGGGVQSAHIIDGSKPHSLLLELFTDAGIGTMVTP